MAETITLSGVPETMLQTIYARAKESRGRGAIRDLKAEEIIVWTTIFPSPTMTPPCTAASSPAPSCSTGWWGNTWRRIPALVIIEGLTMYLTQAAALNAAFDARLQALRADNAAAGKEKQFHLEKQILPGIAAYETLQTVMPKEEALQTVHGYVEQRAWKLRKLFLALMHVPGLPRKTPGIFTKQTRRMFGEAAGFEAREIETTGGVWRIDMTKCPYHDACVHYGCPELCPCFCDSDDITYDDLHPDLLWRRTRTLGRGNDCCDFCLKLR